MNKDEVWEFLYMNPPLGQPDDNISISTMFEAGGLNEDWGFVVKKSGRIICSGQTLDGTVKMARQILIKEKEVLDTIVSSIESAAEEIINGQKG